ncbi:MAG: hypothetical protein A3H45_11570 [Ignavibacteria bacterium RIFCSPLOWO2_02_FULL_55_14]|nr:MAG: hypothetical protein A2X68_05455 [Ignavibacteria bacterium GWC2_56_12]OGU75607.1 MAG: hypothetical protein A3H45_11570 [Ignavibacteria bacterium RIFCSPLOWO2_02_FULL_55_14]HAV24036.1 NADH-quinone oxidoreductase subunit N [Bacteroidota bacterium]
MITFSDLSFAAPILALTVTVLLVMVAEAFRVGSSRFSFFLTLTGLTAAALIAGKGAGTRGAAFQDMVVVDGPTSVLTIIICGTGIVSTLLSRSYLELRGSHRSEFYMLVLFAVVGMILMASAGDLIIVFLGIELMSICLYVLAGFFRTRDVGNESALKYFLLGAFSTGFLLYGIALVYGTTGTTNLSLIGSAYAGVANQPLFLLGVGLLMVGLSFKVAAVPFHMWAPDVYEGAPTVVTGLMATGAKTAAFGAFAAVFLRTFDPAGSTTADVLALLAAASMVVGNIIAIAQTNLKRMLAYSSIAHAGYMLSGIAAGSVEGQNGVILYLAAYAATTLGAFGIVGWLERETGEGTSLEEYAGLSKHQPVIAALMALFMFSLTGIPPFAGFIGKYSVFLAAVRADMTWLAVVGVLTSAVSAYYYLRVVDMMYFREREGDVIRLPNFSIMLALAISAFFVVVLGVLPSIVLDIVAPGL